MNTYPIALSRVLYGCGALQTHWQIHEPIFGKQGDACVVGGFDAETLTATAVNHDPQHVPYGICWVDSNATIAQRALWKMLAESAREERAVRWAPWHNRSMVKPGGETRWTGGEAMGSADCSIAGDMNMEEPAAAAAGVATEHSQDDSAPEMVGQECTSDMASQETPDDMKMIYSIVNEFLGNMTFYNPEAEALLQAALTDESSLPASIQERLNEVFSPIFFYFPNGLKDRSVWEARNTTQYITEWKRLASMRSRFGHATEDSGQLSKEEVAAIFKEYIADMKAKLRPDQRNRDEAYYRSCAGAKLRKEAGSTNVAKAIWAIGLPPLPWCWTDKRESLLSEEDLEAVPGAIDSVLKWLDRVATELTVYHTTKEYQNAVRKAGHAHGETGLTVAEQETREAIRRVKREIRTAKYLATQWEAHLVMPGLQWQQTLLQAYWDGSLERRLEEVSRKGSGDTMCRSPLFARPP